MKKNCIPIFLIAFLCACASSPISKSGSINKNAGPAWVNGEDRKYSLSEYMMGIGSADDMETAKDRARGEIAKVFSSDISAKSAVFESERTVSAASGKSNTEAYTGVSSDIKTTANKTIEGIEIADTWFNENDFRWYALAILSRAKIRGIYASRLADIESQINGYKINMEEASSNMARAMAALRIKSLLKERASVGKDLRVISGAGSFEALDNTSLIAKVNEVIEELKIYISVSPKNENIHAEIIKTLSSLGMKTSIKQAGADINISCSIEMSPMTDISTVSKWQWYTGNASTVLTDVQAGKAFLSFNTSAKEAYVNAAGAKANAEKSLGRKIGKAINAGIENYFADK